MENMNTLDLDNNVLNIIGDYFGVSFLNIDMYFFTRG